MKLRRQKRKKDQALDAVASVTKLWSEWQLSKRAGKGIAKAKAIKPPSKLKRLLGSKKVKVVGAAAVAGGAGAVVARKLKGDDPATSYTGPPPSDAVEAAASAPDAPPPPVVAVPDPDPTPAAGASALRATRDEAAGGTSALPGASDGSGLAGEPASAGDAEPEAVEDDAVTAAVDATADDDFSAGGTVELDDATAGAPADDDDK